MGVSIYTNNGLPKKILLGFILLCLVLASAYFTTMLGPKKGIAIGFSIIGAAIGIYSLINYVFGFYICLIAGFLIFFVGRVLHQPFPSALLVDLQIMITFTGLIIHKIVKREPFFKNARHIITFGYLLYTVFLLAEIFNPSMYSIAGWVLVIRKFLEFLMIYFIALSIFENIQRVRFFFISWIGLAFITALYGCYQEWFGYMSFELDWIWSVQGRAGLYGLNDGSFRKFSFLSDPAAFGIIMAASALIVIVLAISSKKRTKKFLLITSGLFILLAVGYSGTRTAYFIIAASLVFYILMTITRRHTLVFACIFIMAFVVLMFGPFYGNTTINRIRTTFDSKDASMGVRDKNRQSIQPYIYRHPIGGGLATSGIQGLEYNPGHYLAGFPPDSGYMKSAIETGWIGFIFQCLLYFLALKAGIHGYYNTTNRKIKYYYLATVVCVFCFVIAQFGQEAIGQIPGCFLFYSCLAAIVRLKNLEVPEEKTLNI